MPSSSSVQISTGCPDSECIPLRTPGTILSVGGGQWPFRFGRRGRRCRAAPSARAGGRASNDHQATQTPARAPRQAAEGERQATGDDASRPTRPGRSRHPRIAPQKDPGDEPLGRREMALRRAGGRHDLLQHLRAALLLSAKWTVNYSVASFVGRGDRVKR